MTIYSGPVFGMAVGAEKVRAAGTARALLP
jgi:hypothetical protein